MGFLLESGITVDRFSWKQGGVIGPYLNVVEAKGNQLMVLFGNMPIKYIFCAEMHIKSANVERNTSKKSQKERGN